MAGTRGPTGKTARLNDWKTGFKFVVGACCHLRTNYRIYSHNEPTRVMNPPPTFILENLLFCHWIKNAAEICFYLSIVADAVDDRSNLISRHSTRRNAKNAIQHKEISTLAGDVSGNAVAHNFKIARLRCATCWTQKPCAIKTLRRANKAQNALHIPSLLFAAPAGFGGVRTKH